MAEKTKTITQKEISPAGAVQPEVSPAFIDPHQVEVELPSRGKFYDGKLPDGKVIIRPVKVSEEKILAGGGNRMALVDKVLEKCMLTKTVAVRDMLISDKFWILLNLRAISYGSDYVFSLKCGTCGTEFTHGITLPTGLSVKRATETDKEPFDVALPVAGKTVSLRFLRGSDEDEIDRYIKQLPRGSSDEGDPSYVYRLSRFIVKIDGKDIDPLEKMNFCENLVGKDSLAIRRAIAENETGPVLSIQTRCPGCKNDVVTSLPLTNEFFPSSVA